MPKQIPKTPFPKFKKPDLSTLHHEDSCCFHYDPEFCSCGADAWAELGFYKTANKELEKALQKQQEELEQLQKPMKSINRYWQK